MAAEFFWRRVPSEALSRPLPDPADDLRDGRLVVIHSTGAEIAQVLRAERLRCELAEPVAVYPPDAVRRIARQFAEIPLAHWVEANRVALGANHRLLRDAQDVAGLFRAASATGEAVVVRPAV